MSGLTRSFGGMGGGGGAGGGMAATLKVCRTVCLEPFYPGMRTDWY